MDHGTAEFLRDDIIDANPMIWFVQVDGLIVDARELPLPVQAQAFELVPPPGSPTGEFITSSEMERRRIISRTLAAEFLVSSDHS
jgi:hypothetical protein